MGKLDGIDTAGRKIAGLLGYSPGPGIYSRLERAIEQMPESVRVQELPGLLRRYKDGVPGWELKASGLDELTAGRDVVTRDELLARVRDRSPVYTHGEKLLGGDVPVRRIRNSVQSEDLPAYDRRPFTSIGSAESSGRPVYESYGQGGKNYGELLITQPGVLGEQFGSHWNEVFGGQGAVAHARFDTHGDALRINELQSDLGIHNRKARQWEPPPPRPEGAPPAPAMGGMRPQGIPFPLEDAWADLLIKRLALEAARKGHRAIEVASPRAIADKVGGNIDNYEHFYGKVVPGALERLGRKMGGLVEDAPLPASNAYEENLEALRRAYDEPSGEALALLKNLRDGRISWKPQGAFDPTAGDRFDFLTHAYQSAMGVRRAGELPGRGAIASRAEELYATLVEDLVSRGIDPASAARQSVEAMPRLMRLAEEQAARANSFVGAQIAPHAPPPSAGAKEPRRYLMSDEMRRRIIQEGIPAAVAVGIGADQMIDRLDRERR